MKKYYPALPAFSFAMEPEILKGKVSRLIESLIVRGAKFFYRTATGKEVDGIFTNKKIIPVDVKYIDALRIKNVPGLFSFMNRHGVKKGYVVTRYFAGKLKKNDKVVEAIPLLEWMLRRDGLRH